MIRKLSHESPAEWNRFVPAALFAYRNQVHSSTGFSPFFLLFGRAPRGPMQILNDIFLNKDLSGETSFQYHYIIDLHNRIRKGWRLAQDSVRDSVDESRLRHEPKSKLKHFVPGDEVLVLLPTSDNKLVLSYKGPYRMVERRTSVVYLVDLGDWKCTFHVNLLRKYKRSTYASPSHSDNLDKVDNACSNQAFAGPTSLCDPSVFPFSSLSTVESSLSVDPVVVKELDPNHDSDLRFCETICFAEPSAYVSAISEEDGGEIGSLVTTLPLASESGTVVIDPSLSSSQVQDVKELLIEFQDFLTSVPGCTSTLCHEIRLNTDVVIRVKPYPLPFAAREFVTQEVNDLLPLGVIEPSDSPYCFPIVVVKTKDGSMRLCIGFRKLNPVTVFGAENIPRQEDLFNQLSHATIFSSCDLCKAYWQVPLHPDSHMQETFVVRSDALDFGIGAVLLQDRDGILMPCRYTSRKLLSRESRYSAIEREALALILAITQFQRYLTFKHFILQTDHKPLSYLREGSPKNARLMRWALALQKFSFQVVHIPGSENVHADVLSRLC
ncbi:retrovirus-related pol polyprotein from transposon 17.6 [Plakobranchus ocellatus]|uniref:Retrovirus-related pol polyprotein from transposon 17.6 n=1 Tax=Plakobranchus ocellatus TaxID=259542 RepID=A0AAV4DP94_9GAST|nr:retrovirus-related pol polyprotein from transposon 17.6 [Plakobranchus ocellatus]